MDIKKTVNITPKAIQTRDSNDELAILKQARERAKEGYSAWKDNYNRAETDVAFAFGKMDTGENNVDEDNRLSLSFNRLPQFVNRVIGAQRSTVQSINVAQTGTVTGADEPVLTTTAGKEVKLSDTLSAIIRDIEYQSNAIAHYKNSFKHGLEGGFGWLRVLTQYQQNGFDLEARIKAVRDRWSVIIDPKAQEPDKSDMNWAFISERISKKEFEKRYPGKNTEAITGIDNDSTFWGDEETVTVTEYFRREPHKRTIVLLSDGTIADKDEIKDVEETLIQQGIKIEKERETTDYKVIWCKISASNILENEIEFPTSTIPIIPVFGRVTDFRKKMMLKGLTADAKDPQIALDKMISSAIERIDESPLSPFIATDKAIEGYEEIWANANKTKYSVLPYKKGEERPKRDMGATIPIAELNTIPILDDSIKSSVGMFNASLGQQSNETSGVAIRARQSEGDIGTYEFIDNYQNAIRRVGILLVELVPRIYDTNRLVNIRNIDGSTNTIELNKVITNTQTGKPIVIHSLDFGEHTVTISAGATYNTKREENADQIMKLMQVNQQIAQTGADLLVKNLDFSESDVLASRLEKTIPPQLLSKEQRDKIAKDMPQGQQDKPSPEEIKAQTEIQIEQIRLEIEKVKLETARILAEQKIQESEDKKRQVIAEGIAKNLTKQGE